MGSERSSTLDTSETLRLGTQIINFMGPEGSGKTTISKKLAVETGKPRIVFGDIFRDLAANDPGPQGDECRALFAEHRYIKPEMFFEIMVDRFRQPYLEGGFIIDGAMRLVEEIKGFQEMLDASGRSMPVTNIFLHVPGWKGVDRILNDSSTRNRTDDDPEAILSRLSNFYNNLGERASLIEQQPNWSLKIVNGIGSVDETFERVRESLG